MSPPPASLPRRSDLPAPHAGSAGDSDARGNTATFGQRRRLLNPGRSGRFCGLVLAALLLAGTTVQAAPTDSEALRSVVDQGAAVLLPGRIRPEQIQIAPGRDGMHIHLPVQDSTISIEAMVRPAGDGAWDILSAAIPPSGEIRGPSPGDLTRYSLGALAVHGHLDPGLETASSGHASLRNLTLVGRPGGLASRQTVGEATVDSALAPAKQGLLDLHARLAASGYDAWRQQDLATGSDARIATLTANAAILGIDPNQPQPILALLRSLRDSLATPASKAGWRPVVRALLDAWPGALQGFEIDETSDNASFAIRELPVAGQSERGQTERGQPDPGRRERDLAGAAGPETARASVGRMQLSLTGNAHGDTLDSRLSVVADDLGATGLPPDLAAFLPRHLALTETASGLQAAKLDALLRDALAPAADPIVLRQQALALLATPGARVELSTLSLDTATLHVSATGHLQPMADDDRLGGTLHVVATGFDALLAQARLAPSLGLTNLGLLIAKGLGRTKGSETVWDIVIGNGPLTVNGVPLIGVFGPDQAPPVPHSR